MSFLLQPPVQARHASALIPGASYFDALGLPKAAICGAPLVNKPAKYPLSGKIPVSKWVITHLIIDDH